MALPSSYLPFIEVFIEQPILVVTMASFGVPLFMLLCILPIKLYKNWKHADALNTIIFVSLSFTWIAGFVITLTLFFMRTDGLKLYLIWFVLLLSSFIFTSFNHISIAKYYDDSSEKTLIKKKFSRLKKRSNSS